MPVTGLAGHGLPTYRKRDWLKSSPGEEDTGEGGPKHQLILSAKTRSGCKPGHDAVRAQADLPDFFEDLAGNHGWRDA